MFRKRMLPVWMGIVLLSGMFLMGQDTYWDVPFRYTINEDGTVSDLFTGLMWQQCTATKSGEDCSSGSAARRSWSSASSYCTGLTLAGHTDWRLPQAGELSSILSGSTVNPKIDPVAFPGTFSAGYWSATVFSIPAFAYYVDFGYGGSYSALMTDRFYVRCVR